jgi:hypothetical protein
VKYVHHILDKRFVLPLKANRKVALQSKIYLSALQTAFAELGKLNPRALTA